MKIVTLEDFELYHKLLKQYIDGNDSQSVDLVEMTKNILDDADKENADQEN